MTWPAGDGEMARRIRAHDWAATALGAIDGWPQTLRTALDIVLAMPGPATILWGPAAIQLYNDAYIAVGRERHPALLGRSAAANWPDAYAEVIAPLLAAARAGRGTRLVDLPVTLSGSDGHADERVFDTDWSPIRNENGAVEGVLHTLAEVTDRSRSQARLLAGEERQAFLLALTDALRPLDDPAAVKEVAARCLGQHLGVSRALFTELQVEDGVEYVVVECDYNAVGGASIAGRHLAEQFASDLAPHRAGQPVMVADTERELPTEAERAVWRELGARSYLGVPFLKNGRLVATFGVHNATPREWTAEDVSLVEEAAERTWAAVERARAEHALRASEEKYRTLFDTMGQGYCELELLRDGNGRAVDQLYLELNPAFERLFGIAAADAKGRKASEIFPVVDQIWHQRFDEVVRTGRYKRFEHHHGPMHRWYEVFVYPRGGDRVVVLYEEITGRKRTEQTLRESEDRQAFLLELGDAIRAESAADGKIAVAARLLGEKLDASRVLYAEYDLEKGFAYIFNGWLADGAQPFPSELRLEDFEGDVLDDLRNGRIVRIDDVGALGSNSGYAAIASVGVQALLSSPLLVGGTLKFNISIHQHEPRHWSDDEVSLVREAWERLCGEIVRAHAEQALREREERYRSVFETIDEGFCIWEVVQDADWKVVDLRFVEVNSAFERQTGLVDVVGRLVSQVAPGTEAEWIETYGEVARTGTARRFEMYHADTGRWYDIYATPLSGLDSPRVSIVFRDITERRRADEVERKDQERQAFLLMLSDRLRAEPDAHAAAATAVSLLADHLRLDRAYVASVDKDRDLAEIGPEYRCPGLPPVQGTLALSNFPQAFATVEVATLALADTTTDPTLSDLDRQNFAALRMGALIVASARRGANHPIWALLVATERPRRWTAAEIALVEEAAERTWAAVERARTEAALRQSEERNAFLVRFSDAVRGLDEPLLIAREACRILTDQLRTERTLWAVIDWEAKEYVADWSFLADGTRVEPSRWPFDESQPFAMEHLAGRSVAYDDAADDPRLPDPVKEAMIASGLMAGVAVPVSVAGKLLAEIGRAHV